MKLRLYIAWNSLNNKTEDVGKKKRTKFFVRIINTINI